MRIEDGRIKRRAQALLSNLVFIELLKDVKEARNAVRTCQNKTVINKNGKDVTLPCMGGWITVQKDETICRAKCSCLQNYFNLLRRLEEFAQEAYPFFVEKFNLANIKPDWDSRRKMEGKSA